MKQLFKTNLESEQLAALRALAKESSDSVAWHIRRAVKEYLEKTKGAALAV